MVKNGSVCMCVCVNYKYSSWKILVLIYNDKHYNYQTENMVKKNKGGLITEAGEKNEIYIYIYKYIHTHTNMHIYIDIYINIDVYIYLLCYEIYISVSSLTLRGTGGGPSR